MRLRSVLVRLAIVLLSIGGMTQTTLLRAEPCETPVSLQVFEAKLNQSRSRIFLVKFDDALRLLDDAEDMLHCLDAPVERGILTRLYLYRGVAEFNKQDEAQTLRNFEYAVAIDRSSRWDDRFGQRPRELFIEAKEAALLAPKGRVRIPPLRENATLFLDGKEEHANTLVSLAPGKHLLQIRADDRIVFGQLFDVVSDAEVQPPVPTAWLSSPTSSPKKPETVSSEGGTSLGGGRDVESSPPRAPFNPRKLRPVSYVLLGFAGVTTTSALVGGYLTLSIQKDLQENYYSNRPDQEKDDLLARQASMAALTNTSIVAAVVTGGVGGALFVLSRDRDNALTRFHPWMGPRSGGFLLSGRF